VRTYPANILLKSVQNFSSYFVDRHEIQRQTHRSTLNVIAVGMGRSRGQIPLHPRYNAVMGVAARAAL